MGGGWQRDEELRELSRPGAVGCVPIWPGAVRSSTGRRSALFTQLADYFKAKTLRAEARSSPDFRAGRPGFKRGAPQAEAAARENGDQGAQQLVWSRKVTRILDALLKRWEKRGKPWSTPISMCDTH